MEEHNRQWHPAFQAALQIDLEERTYLHFYPEYNLTKKPQQRR